MLSLAQVELPAVAAEAPAPWQPQTALRDDLLPALTEVVGYLSGGCVEAAVATEALAVLAAGRACGKRWPEMKAHLAPKAMA